MAALLIIDRLRRRLLRRERIFRDRNHPLEKYNDQELYNKFRFRREDILELTDSIAETIELSNRTGALSPVLQSVCGELIGVHQTTACRTIKRVTEALLPSLPYWIHLPNAEEARKTKTKFFEKYGFPDVCGCIDGTHVRILSPGAAGNEHEFINRKGYHSINVQVICDADLMFIDIIARWPGSVHDARILRQSDLFLDMEGNQPPLQGHFLGDSGYMLRNWLLTPILNPHTEAEELYNEYHRKTRSIVERSIGVAKKRWHCLHNLRVAPDRACQIITVCLILHNRARFLALPDPDDEEEDADEGGHELGHDRDNAQLQGEGNGNEHPQERIRVDAGRIARNRLIAFFADQHNP